MVMCESRNDCVPTWKLCRRFIPIANACVRAMDAVSRFSEHLIFGASLEFAQDHKPQNSANRSPEFVDAKKSLGGHSIVYIEMCRL